MPLTVLVVDDDPGVRLTIVDYLELAGYLAIGVSNGREALQAVAHFDPNLVITDAIMPELDGYDLIRNLRQQPEYRLLPVVFLTARTELADRIRGYRAGVDIYLPKPFELDELGAIVRNLLDRALLIGQATHAVELMGESATQHISVSHVSDLSFNLTPRERETIALVVQGFSNAEIGAKLFLSARTIEKYVSKLLDKTNTRNRLELARFAIEHHLDTPN